MTHAVSAMLRLQICQEKDILWHSIRRKDESSCKNRQQKDVLMRKNRQQEDVSMHKNRQQKDVSMHKNCQQEDDSVLKVVWKRRLVALN